MSDYTRQEAAKLAAIMDCEKHVDRLRLKADIAKRKASLAKRQYEHANEELHELIRADVQQTMLPGMESEPMERAVPTWQDDPVSVVVDDKAIVEKLAEHNITSLGQLAAYTNADQSLTKVGLTEHQEAKLVEALQLYWSDEPNSPGGDA